jgi:hypothetical protein
MSDWPATVQDRAAEPEGLYRGAAVVEASAVAVEQALVIPL